MSGLGDLVNRLEEHLVSLAETERKSNLTIVDRLITIEERLTILGIRNVLQHRTHPESLSKEETAKLKEYLAKHCLRITDIVPLPVLGNRAGIFYAVADSIGEFGPDSSKKPSPYELLAPGRRVMLKRQRGRVVRSGKSTDNAARDDAAAKSKLMQSVSDMVDTWEKFITVLNWSNAALSNSSSDEREFLRIFTLKKLAGLVVTYSQLATAYSLLPDDLKDEFFANIDATKLATLIFKTRTIGSDNAAGVAATDEAAHAAVLEGLIRVLIAKITNREMLITLLATVITEDADRRHFLAAFNEKTLADVLLGIDVSEQRANAAAGYMPMMFRAKPLLLEFVEDKIDELLKDPSVYKRDNDSFNKALLYGLTSLYRRYRDKHDEFLNPTLNMVSGYGKTPKFADLDKLHAKLCGLEVVSWSEIHDVVKELPTFQNGFLYNVFTQIDRMRDPLYLTPAQPTAAAATATATDNPETLTPPIPPIPPSSPSMRRAS